MARPGALNSRGARLFAAAALALHDLGKGLPFLEEVQIGITRGRVRSGAYGSRTRRTYSVIGDPVNLSARLMAAVPRALARPIRA